MHRYPEILFKQILNLSNSIHRESDHIRFSAVLISTFLFECPICLIIPDFVFGAKYIRVGVQKVYPADLRIRLN